MNLMKSFSMLVLATLLALHGQLLHAQPLDSSLPVEIRGEILLKTAKSHADAGRWREAVAALEEYRRLGVPVENLFYFQYGKALLLAGETEQGVAQLTAYLVKAGEQAKEGEDPARFAETITNLHRHVLARNLAPSLGGGLRRRVVSALIGLDKKDESDGHWNRAAEDYTELARLGVLSEDAEFDRADTNYKARRYTATIELLTAYLKHYPNGPHQSQATDLFVECKPKADQAEREEAAQRERDAREKAAREQQAAQERAVREQKAAEEKAAKERADRLLAERDRAAQEQAAREKRLVSLAERKTAIEAAIIEEGNKIKEPFWIQFDKLRTEWSLKVREVDTSYSSLFSRHTETNVIQESYRLEKHGKGEDRSFDVLTTKKHVTGNDTFGWRDGKDEARGLKPELISLRTFVPENEDHMVCEISGQRRVANAVFLDGKSRSFIGFKVHLHLRENDSSAFTQIAGLFRDRKKLEIELQGIERETAQLRAAMSRYQQSLKTGPDK
jgi:hypothetical protein